MEYCGIWCWCPAIGIGTVHTGCKKCICNIVSDRGADSKCGRISRTSNNYYTGLPYFTGAAVRYRPVIINSCEDLRGEYLR